MGIGTGVITPLAIDLLPHQLEAVSFAMTHKQAYLALDMGLGKTAVAIEIVNRLKAEGQTPTLIVIPPSLRDTWSYEFKKFAPHLKVEVLRGAASKPLPPADAYIIGDSVIQNWTEDLDVDCHSLLGKVTNLIVDEAHRAKNIPAARTRALIKLANTVPNVRVLMSGTPTPNGRNQEIGTQIEILGDDAWLGVGGKAVFWSYYCPVERDKDGRRNRSGKRASYDSLGLHEAMMNSFMMRLRRGDVLDLPNKGRSALYVEGQGNAVSDYRYAENDLVGYLASAGKEWRGAMRNEALVKLGVMRKLAGECKVPGIITHAKEYLLETQDYDVVPGLFIVAEHYSVMEPLRYGLEKYGVVMYNGDCDEKSKSQAVSDFTTGKARVMIGQIKSAGIGLTLHGDGRNHRVMITQLPWSPSDITQAEDRLHRIGQTSDVEVEICLAHIDGSYTIDERLWGLLETKAFSAGEIVDGRGEFLLEEIEDTIIDSYR